MKPRIAPYRADRPGKLICYSPALPNGRPHYQGTGYTAADAYQRWLNAVTCSKPDSVEQELSGIPPVVRRPA